MAYKTMLRQLISRGPMSVEMNKAYVGDQAVLDENMQPHYVDNVADEPTRFEDVLSEVEGGEITEIKEDGNAES
jgi:recombinational DNA repair protein RecT